MAAKRLWTEVYRPSTLDGYVFQNEDQQKQLTRFIVDQDIPHLLLTGTQGSGKTTIAEILIKALGINDEDVLRINASDKTGVDYIRDTILGFASLYPMGKFKIIKLEEFDYMSQAAQGMLRAVMEENADTCRFVCTCNYENKIIPALKSRMQHLRFKAPNRDDVLVRMVEILVTEDVQFDLEILEKYVDQAYPDIRKIINNMQLNTNAAVLGNPQVDADGGDYQFKLLDLLSAGDLRGIRTTVSEQLTSDQIGEVYEFLYRNLKKHPVFADAAGRELYEQALVTLNDGMYKHGLVALPHLNFESTCIRLFALTGE